MEAGTGKGLRLDHSVCRQDWDVGKSESLGKPLGFEKHPGQGRGHRWRLLI